MMPKASFQQNTHLFPNMSMFSFSSWNLKTCKMIYKVPQAVLAKDGHF